MDAVIFIGKFGSRNKSQIFQILDGRHSSKTHLTISYSQKTMFNMKKLLPGFFCMCLLLFYHQTAAQMVSISGKVTSADDGTSLPGVSILIKGTTTGVSTDIDGQYQISAPNKAVCWYLALSVWCHRKRW